MHATKSPLEVRPAQFGKTRTSQSLVPSNRAAGCLVHGVSRRQLKSAPRRATGDIKKFPASKRGRQCWHTSILPRDTMVGQRRLRKPCQRLDQSAEACRRSKSRASSVAPTPRVPWLPRWVMSSIGLTLRQKESNPGGTADGDLTTLVGKTEVHRFSVQPQQCRRLY